MVGLPIAVTFWMSATELKPCFSMSLRLIANTGWAVSTSTWRMREPVISMRSRLVGVALLPSWANAGRAANVAVVARGIADGLPSAVVREVMASSQVVHKTPKWASKPAGLMTEPVTDSSLVS